MREEDVIDMAPNEEGVYEQVPSKRTKSSSKKKEKPPIFRREKLVSGGFVTSGDLEEPKTFLEGLGEGLRLIARSGERIEHFLAGILEEGDEDG